MEPLRAGYSANVRFWQDSDETTRIRWYRVPREREILQYASPYTSYVWDYGPSPREPGVVRGTEFIGEQLDNFRPFSDLVEAPAAPQGDHVCGSSLQWRGFMLLNESPPTRLNPMGWLPCCVPEQEDNLQLWLDARDLNLVGGDRVENWKDHRGGSQGAAQDVVAFQPVYLSGLLVPHPGVLFAGTQFMELAESVSGVPFTLVWVGNTSLLNIRLGLPLGQNAGAPLTAFAVQRFDVPPVTLRFNTSLNGVLRGASFPMAQPWIASVSYDPITGVLTNRVAAGGSGGTNVQSVAMTDFRMSFLGGTPGLVLPMSPGSINELVFWSRLLDDEELEAVFQRLSTKWAIPLT